MWLEEFKKYFGLFLLGVALIVVYKTFDNLGSLWDGVQYVLSLLTPFFVGGIIAYVLYIPCRKLEMLCQKTKSSFISKHRRSISVSAIYLIFVAAIVLVLVAIIPSLIKSVTEFMEQLPYLIQGAVNWVNSLGIYKIDSNTLQKLLSSDNLSLDKIMGGISFDNMNKYAKGVMTFGTSLFNVFICIIISIYLLLDRADIKKSFMRFANTYISEKHRRFLGGYFVKINKYINIYIYCLLVDALIVFVISFLTLTIMQIKYAPLLALMIGVFNLIPYFGAITATVLSALITIFTKSFAAGVGVAVALIIIQQVDANIIQPRLLSESLNVKPVWVILAIILGGGLFGILGILLAVPFFALIRIVCLDIIDARESKSVSVTDVPPEKTEE